MPKFIRCDRYVVDIATTTDRFQKYGSSTLVLTYESDYFWVNLEKVSSITAEYCYLENSKTEAMFLKLVVDGKEIFVDAKLSDFGIEDEV